MPEEDTQKRLEEKYSFVVEEDAKWDHIY